MIPAALIRRALRLVIVMLVAAVAPRAQAKESAMPEASLMADVRHVLERTPLIDGHNDLAEQLRDRVKNQLDSLDLAGDTGRLRPPMQTDIARLRRGGVGGVFFAAYVPFDLKGPPAVALMFEQIDVIRRVAARYPEALALATSAADVERIHRAGKIAALIGVEGGHAIGNSLAVLRQAYQGGARYLTLTHLKSNDWADAAIWPGVGADSLRHGGLTPFGREVIREMNRLGMLVDLSHTAEATMLAALETSEAPVIFSHSGARAVCDHPRNVPDEVLHRVAAKGGVVMVDFVPGFTTNEYRDWEGPAWAEWQRLEKLHPDDRQAVTTEFETWKAQHPAPRVTLSQVADHIDHVRQVAGIDHVGIGTDFEGSEAFPVGLEDTSCYPALLAELLRRGYSTDAIAKVAGGNLLRVMRGAEEVARRLQKARGPADALIDDLDRLPPAPSSAPKAP
jgi:membrane dipeptidase